MSQLVQSATPRPRQASPRGGPVFASCSAGLTSGPSVSGPLKTPPASGGGLPIRYLELGNACWIRYGIARDSGVTARDEVGEQPRDAGKPSFDRAHRQTKYAILQADHPGILAGDSAVPRGGRTRRRS